MTVFLIQVPESTMEYDVMHDEFTATPEVRDWLTENNIVAWSIVTDSDGTIKFIFIDEVHAMLFRLRWS